MTFLFRKNVWQQYARCTGTFNKLHFTENVPGNLPVTKILKIGSDLTELWPRVCGLNFFVHPVYYAELRVHLCVQNDAREAARRAGPSATADT